MAAQRPKIGSQNFQKPKISQKIFFSEKKISTPKKIFFFKIPKHIDFVTYVLYDFGTGGKKNGFLNSVFI